MSAIPHCILWPNQNIQFWQLCSNPSPEPTVSTSVYSTQSTLIVMKLSFSRQQVCIRQASGFCCVQYTICSDTSSFSLTPNTNTVSLADGNCVSDYIALNGTYWNQQYCDARLFHHIHYGSGASNSCTGSANNVDVVSKICGNVFNTLLNTKTTAGNIAICGE